MSRCVNSNFDQKSHLKLFIFDLIRVVSWYFTEFTFYSLRQIIEVGGGSRTPTLPYNDSSKDLSIMDSPQMVNSSNSSLSRPLDTTRQGRSLNSNGNGSSRRSMSGVRPGAGSPEDDVSVMVRNVNSQLVEQKKAVAKISKLCLGALSAIDKLETRIGKI